MATSGILGAAGGALIVGVGGCGEATETATDVDALDVESEMFCAGVEGAVLGFLLKSDKSLVALLPTRGPDTFFAEEPGRLSGSNRSVVGVVLVGVVGARFGVAILFLPEVPILVGVVGAFLVGVVVGDAPMFGDRAMMDLHFFKVQLNTAGEEEDILCAASWETAFTPNLWETYDKGLVHHGRYQARVESPPTSHMRAMHWRQLMQTDVPV